MSPHWNEKNKRRKLNNFTENKNQDGWLFNLMMANFSQGPLPFSLYIQSTLDSTKIK